MLNEILDPTYLKEKIANLDVLLSTRASESTLSAIKSKTDNLDVALSTRASETTLSAIKNALASVGTDKLRASIVDSLPSGANKIGSVDVASIPNPSNLDVALSTRASESTLSGIKSQTDKLQFDASNNLKVAAVSSPSLFVKDLNVGTSASQVDTDTSSRDAVTLLADPNNTDKIFVGTSGSQLFPLLAGASITITKTSLNLIYVKSNSGTQSLHVICGGS